MFRKSQEENLFALLFWGETIKDPDRKARTDAGFLIPRGFNIVEEGEGLQLGSFSVTPSRGIHILTETHNVISTTRKPYWQNAL